MLLLFQLFYIVVYLLSFVRNLQCPNEEILNEKLSNIHIPGAAIVVVNQSSILYEKSFGYESIGSSKLIRINESIFTLASLSKTFLSIGVMQLVELNQLDLDEDINMYLNETIVHPLFPSSKITLRHLLSHRASIQSNNELHLRENDRAFEEFHLADYCFDYLKSNESNWLKSRPGSETVYSNEGTALIAIIIELVSNMSFENYIRKKILKPLNINLNRTSYRLSQIRNSNDLVEQYAYVHNSTEFLLWKQTFAQLNISQLNGNYPTWIHIPLFSFPVYPAGLLRMTGSDLAKFIQMFMNDGWPLIRKQSIDEIKEIQSNESLSDVEFGLIWNWRSYDDGTRFIGHRGTNFGSTHLMMIDQSNRIGTLILTNGDMSLPNELSKTIYTTLTHIHQAIFNCFSHENIK